jgi:hypothetical protein
MENGSSAVNRMQKRSKVESRTANNGLQPETRQRDVMARTKGGNAEFRKRIRVFAAESVGHYQKRLGR